MKQSELMQLLTNMQRQIEDLSDRVTALENPIVVNSGGGPGSEDQGGGG